MDRPGDAAGRKVGEPADAAPAAAAALAVSDRDFARFQALIHREAGIWLAPVKKALLVGRLAKRLRALALDSYGAYYERVVQDEAERIRMLDCICTNETHFFREPRHFDFLTERVFPAWREDAAAGRRPPRVRVWSTACSTGEEPYTIAMVLLGAFPAWELDVLATDLSTRVLERAAAGIWPLEKSSEIPETYLKAFMLKGHGAQAGLMKAGPEIRAIVRFDRVNLVGGGWPPPGPPFDLVFCRNVLMYFDLQSKMAVVERLLERVDPHGYLFLGHAESLGGFTDRARPVLPTVYQPAPRAP